MTNSYINVQDCKCKTLNAILRLLFEVNGVYNLYFHVSLLLCVCKIQLVITVSLVEMYSFCPFFFLKKKIFPPFVFK